jgi:hypothetical protein
MHPTKGRGGAVVWPIDEIAKVRAMVGILSAHRVIDFDTRPFRVRIMFRLKYSENLHSIIQSLHPKYPGRPLGGREVATSENDAVRSTPLREARSDGGERGA